MLAKTVNRFFVVFPLFLSHTRSHHTSHITPTLSLDSRSATATKENTTLSLVRHVPSARPVSSKIKAPNQVLRVKSAQQDTTASSQVPPPALTSVASNPPIASMTSTLTPRFFKLMVNHLVIASSVLSVAPASVPSTAQVFVHSLAGGKYPPTSEI